VTIVSAGQAAPKARVAMPKPRRPPRRSPTPSSPQAKIVAPISPAVATMSSVSSFSEQAASSPSA
jgi:hypothetical protein